MNTINRELNLKLYYLVFLVFFFVFQIQANDHENYDVKNIARKIPLHDDNYQNQHSGVIDLIFAHSFESQWLINQNGQEAENIVDNIGQPILVNVESVESTTIDQVEYVKVKASGIPSYETIATQTLIDNLNNRPKAVTDFATGQTTINSGDVISFGEDIGYNSRSNGTCQITGGYGYWPPGPDCPEDTAKTGQFPVLPEPGSLTCETGLGVIGYFVNGVSIYNWGDGQSYNNQRNWFNLAAKAEVYDLDVCDGHAAQGDYHHHFYSDCLAKAVGDDANGHSPVYGYAADGYPVHGPWHDQGVLTKSAWVVRDYNDASDPNGCGGSGARTCTMVDEFNPTLGTQVAAQNGPNTSDTIISMSGNSLPATSGFYYQDYYYDNSLTNSGDDYLDQYSGHNHDNLGYHYHLPTQLNSNSKLVPTFPSTIGPRFYGELPDEGITDCGGNGPPPPPGAR